VAAPSESGPIRGATAPLSAPRVATNDALLALDVKVGEGDHFKRPCPLERTKPQQAYMTIVSSGDLEIESIVNASLINTLRQGTRIKFAIDELGGQMIGAKVTPIGAAVDPVSKTIKVVAALQQRPEGVLPGMAIVLAQRRASLKERQTGIRREIAELNVTAPFGGRVIQMVPNLHVGRWIGIEEPVLVVSADSDSASEFSTKSQRTFRQDGGRCDHRRWRARNPAEAKLAPDPQGARA
jgi:hypothetical protein